MRCCSPPDSCRGQRSFLPVKPARFRSGFRLYWRWKSRRRVGRRNGTQTVFSTADVPRAEVFAYWTDVVRANLTPRHRFEPTNRPHQLSRRAQARDSRRPRLRVLAGIARLLFRRRQRRAQSGAPVKPRANRDRRTAVREQPGQPLLIDHREASAACSPEPIDRTFVRIPREALERRIRARDLRIGLSSLSPAAPALVRERMLDLTHFTLAFKTALGLRLVSTAAPLFPAGH
jgi:hypothetical protein